METSSVFQARSLFTARAKLNKKHPMTGIYKCTYHSWMQEVKLVDKDYEEKRIDHQHAWQRNQECLTRLQDIIEVGTIWLNITGEPVFKIYKGKITMLSELLFKMNDKGSIMLFGYRGPKQEKIPFPASVITKHYEENYKFWTENYNWRKGNAKKIQIGKGELV